MKNKIKGLLLILLIFGVSLLLPGFMENTTKAADDAEWSQDGSGVSDGFMGYTIVEIVPYKGMGELGYLIGGQEPVDSELMPWDDTTPYEFSFINDSAVKLYPSYRESATLPPGTGWRTARTTVTQNGYFERMYTSGDRSGYYTRTTNQTAIEYVGNQQGNRRVKLPDDYNLGNLYDSVSNPLNLKNVKAYFVHQDDSATADVFTREQAYKPYSVTRREDRTGNYDYDVERKIFVLNKDHGLYDVLFVNTGWGGTYYMLGDYEIVEDNSGEYSCGTLVPVPLGAGETGNYNILNNVSTFTYNGNQDQWRWVESNDALNRPNYSIQNDRNSNFRERVWIRGQKFEVTYYYRYRVQIVNNEWFKTKSLGIPADQVNDYPVRVVTLTPEDLNGDYEYIIDQTNLFYINGNYRQNPDYIGFYEKYNDEGLNIPSNLKFSNNKTRRDTLLNFAVNDTNWAVTEKIFKKIAGIGCYKASAIIRNKYYDEAVSSSTSSPYYKYSVNPIKYNYPADYNVRGTSVNLAKLYIMLMQRNMVDFYNSFMNPDPKLQINRITGLSNVSTTTVNETGTTGSYIRRGTNNRSDSPASIYWSTNTFLPFGLDANGVMKTYANYDQLEAAGIRNHNIYASNDLNYNVLVLDDAYYFTHQFDNGIYIPDDAITDSSQQLGELFPGRDTGDGFTLNEFGTLITNNGQGYENTGGVSYPAGSTVEGPPVVEVPDDDPAVIPEDGTDGSNNRTYKRVLNIQPTAYFTNSEANIRAMLSGYEVQIINMTSTQFNGCVEDLNSRYDIIYMGSNVYSNTNYNRFNGSGSTNFNNDSMDTYIYYTSGDYMYQTDYSQAYMSSNDLTTQKKNELAAFLNAGYPVVLEGNLYSLNATNAKVQATTNIYSFINGNRSKANLMNYAKFTGTTAEKASFLTSLRNYLRVIRPVLQLVTPVLPDDSSENYYKVPVDSSSLTISFKILPKNSIQWYTYKAFLYLDKNGDGIFEASEKLNVRANNGAELVNLLESDQPINININDLSALNGVYQWKVIVERSTNSNVRAAITGYVSIKKTKDIYILQLTDNSSAYSLQQAMNESSKQITSLLNTDTFKNTGYKLHFDTKTVSSFVGDYASPNEYVPANPATSKLSKYHLVIFDNPATPIEHTGAIQNIKDEITLRNLGVIFTKNALGYDYQRNLFGTGTRFSFTNTFTYQHIKRNELNSGGWYLILRALGYDHLNPYRDMIGYNNNTDLTSAAAYRTNYLTKANEGTITQYPYKISKAIRMADNENSKYVTINYDLSNSNPNNWERLIGWYCLSDDKSPVIQEAFGPAGDEASRYKGIYSSSPNDVKNNYYLFSNGTCYYTGIRLAAADVSTNVEEMKLFVNTILACHKSALNRVVSTPPDIDITDPEPVLQVDGNYKIIVEPDDLEGTDFILKFELLNSSSDMKLEIKLRKEGATSDTTIQNVYPVVGSGLGTAISVDGTYKFLRDTDYALKIPVSQLDGNTKLTIKATNRENSGDTEEVYLEFVQPPVITILDPATDPAETEAYMYMDLDYSADASSETYLEYEPDLDVEFQVEAMMNYNIVCTSNIDVPANGIKDDVEVETITEDTSEPGVSGRYWLHIPAYFMKDLNVRKLTITATDSTNTNLKDEFTFIISRRSLFPLD